SSSSARDRYSGIQTRQLREIATVKREIFHLAVVNDLAQLRSFRLREFCARLHVYRFRTCADTKREIEGANLIDSDLDIGRFRRSKPRGFGGDCITSGGQADHVIQPVPGGSGLTRQSGPGTGYSNFGGGNFSAFFVANGAGNSALGSLRIS